MSGCWIIAEGYERWEFIFPLLVMEFAKGEGRHTETRIWVVVYERIGGRCVVVICWDLLILPYMLRPLRTQLISLSYQLNQGFGYVRWIGTTASRKAEA